jgi:hypothetical protein
LPTPDGPISNVGVAARPVDSLRRRATPARLRGKTRPWLTYVSMQS